MARVWPSRYPITAPMVANTLASARNRADTCSGVSPRDE